MLSGSRCAVWSGVTGADVTAITMQAPEPVDDIVVNLRGDPEASVFISAKERGKTIPLTPSSPAFADTVTAFVCQFLKLSPLGRRVAGFCGRFLQVPGCRPRRAWRMSSMHCAWIQVRPHFRSSCVAAGQGEGSLSGTIVRSKQGVGGAVWTAANGGRTAQISRAGVCAGL